jgi:hypothetical protein
MYGFGLVVAAVAFAAGPPEAANEGQRSAPSDVLVEVHGTVGRNVKEGSGSAPLFIVAGDIRWQLDFPQRKPLADLARELIGRPARVRGYLTQPQRDKPARAPAASQVLMVTDLARNDTGKPEGCRVLSASGPMENVVAIGGASTGIALILDGFAWELDFRNQKELSATAKELIGKPVKVSGTLKHYPFQGVSRPARWIVEVESLEAVKE